MSSRYKYFPTMLLEYSKKSSEPVRVSTSNIVNFHFTRPDDLYYKEHFEINPFEEENLELDLSHSNLPVVEEVEKITTGRFRDQEYGKKGEITTFVSGAHYPYLFIPHDKWWEYENFQKFPDYPVWYQFKFAEWHKHIVMSKYQTVTYDPIWSIETDSSYLLYMYYYSTTLKYYRPWKYLESSGVLYDGVRIPVYIVAAVCSFGYYLYHHISQRTRLHSILLNEDFWLKDYENMKLQYNKKSPYALFINDSVKRKMDSPVIFFMFGPEGVDKLKKSFKFRGRMTKEDYYEIIKA